MTIGNSKFNFRFTNGILKIQSAAYIPNPIKTPAIKQAIPIIRNSHRNIKDNLLFSIPNSKQLANSFARCFNMKESMYPTNITKSKVIKIGKEIVWKPTCFPTMAIQLDTSIIDNKIVIVVIYKK